MKNSRPAVAAPSAPDLSLRPDPPPESWRRLGWASVALVLCFAWPLWQLVRFAVGRELYSHIVLIPFISAYLVWQKRASLPPASPPLRLLAAALLAAGAVPLAAYVFRPPAGPPEDVLALSTLAFVLLFGGLACLLLGRRLLRAVVFPLSFLIFMVPLPSGLTAAIEAFLQRGSAAAAGFIFSLTTTPVFQHDLVFQLPGISIQVAPECSGIHSSLALFITSLVAGYFFLRSTLGRVILAAAVIPLALIRNGFRVFVIGELCVQISPDMIDSYIHRHGGPIFFVLSLVPFTALLWWLVRREARNQPAASRNGPDVVRGTLSP